MKKELASAGATVRNELATASSKAAAAAKAAVQAVDEVKALTENSGDVNWRSRNGWSPLIGASKQHGS